MSFETIWHISTTLLLSLISGAVVWRLGGPFWLGASGGFIGAVTYPLAMRAASTMARRIKQ